MEHQTDPPSTGPGKHHHTQRDLRRDVQAAAERRGEGVGVRHHVDALRYPGHCLGGCHDALPGITIALDDEGAQCLMAADDVTERTPQGLHVQDTDVENDREVVGDRVRDEVLFQPEPALRPRCGQHAIRRTAHCTHRPRRGAVTREPRPRPWHRVGE